jgi:hypothetical protein
MVLPWLASATDGALVATAPAPTWLRAARALAQMHYLPGQVGWTGLQGATPQIWWLWPPGMGPNHGVGEGRHLGPVMEGPGIGIIGAASGIADRDG